MHFYHQPSQTLKNGPVFFGPRCRCIRVKFNQSISYKTVANNRRTPSQIRIVPSLICRLTVMDHTSSMSYSYLDLLFSLPSFLKWRWGCCQMSPLGVVLDAGHRSLEMNFSSPCPPLHCLFTFLVVSIALFFIFMLLSSHPWNMFEVLSCCRVLRTVSFNLSCTSCYSQQSP